MSVTYKVHHLDPSDPNLPFLAGKFASLRLQALTVSGNVFSSTFDLESSFSPSVWVSRLQRENIHTFIAIAYPSTLPLSQQNIEHGDFIGSATLLGPIPKSEYELPLSNGPEIGEDSEETKWQMAGVFSSPLHRGKGVAKMLIQAAVDFTREKGKRSRIRIVIHWSNVLVKKMYAAMGFVDAGNVTLVEALVTNGEGDLVPGDGGGSDVEKYLTRNGIVMEKVLEKTGP